MSDQVYIFPTDTVWGIGAALSSATAQQRIEEIKRITHPRPYALIFTRPSDLQAWLQIPASWADLAWPSILTCQTTVLFPKAWLLPAAAGAAPESPWIGVRYQTGAALAAIWAQEQEPLISTSLNLTGEPPITQLAAAQAFQQQYAPDAIFQKDPTGASLAGHPSTILAINQMGLPATLSLRVLRGTVGPTLAARLRSMGLNVDGN